MAEIYNSDKENAYIFSTANPYSTALSPLYKARMNTIIKGDEMTGLYRSCLYNPSTKEYVHSEDKTESSCIHQRYSKESGYCYTIYGFNDWARDNAPTSYPIPSYLPSYGNLVYRSESVAGGTYSTNSSYPIHYGTMSNYGVLIDTSSEAAYHYMRSFRVPAEKTSNTIIGGLNAKLGISMVIEDYNKVMPSLITNDSPIAISIKGLNGDGTYGSSGVVGIYKLKSDLNAKAIGNNCYAISLTDVTKGEDILFGKDVNGNSYTRTYTSGKYPYSCVSFTFPAISKVIQWYKNSTGNTTSITLDIPTGIKVAEANVKLIPITDYYCASTTLDSTSSTWVNINNITSVLKLCKYRGAAGTSTHLGIISTSDSIDCTITGYKESHYDTDETDTLLNKGTINISTTISTTTPSGVVNLLPEEINDNAFTHIYLKVVTPDETRNVIIYTNATSLWYVSNPA